MKKNQLWINTRVELQWDATLQRYVEVSAEGYWADVKSVAYAHASPSIDQDTYAWYNDGTESGSTIIGTANNSQSLDADTTYLVRFVIQEVNGGTSNNFSFQLEYDVNNSGTFNNVTSTSNNVRAVVSSNLGTDGSNTTQRLGSGTFISTNAGVDNGDGLAGTASFAGNDETEVVYSIQLRSADLSNGDAVQLRVAGCNTYTNTANATANVANNITVTLTGQSLAVAAGTLTVQANVDTNVSLTPTSLAVTAGTLTITTSSPTEVTLTGQSLAVSPGTLGVSLDRTISTTGQNLAVAAGTLGVSLDRTISTTGQNLAVSPGTLSISTSLNTTVDLTGQSLAVLPGTLSIQADVDTNITLTPTSLAVTAGTLVIDAAVNTVITPAGDSLLISAGSLTIQANVNANITLTPTSLAVTAGQLTITDSNTDSMVYITEYKHIGLDNALRITHYAHSAPQAEQVLSLVGGSTQSAQFQAGTRIIRVHADANIHIAVGANPTATTNSLRLTTDQTEFFCVDPSHKLAAIGG